MGFVYCSIESSSCFLRSEHITLPEILQQTSIPVNYVCMQVNVIQKCVDLESLDEQRNQDNR